MTDISVLSTPYQVEKRSWYLGTAESPGFTISGTLDVSAFTAGIHYPNGYIPSGTPLGRITASGLYAPYTVSDEVQLLTPGGSGLTSFTITYAGQTTGSLDDQATAAEVQAALEALSNLAPGDVVVTGAAGGPWTLTFGGTLIDTNVAAVTTTPTGGTGVVTVTTPTAGGAEPSDGSQVAVGLLFSAVKVPNPANTAIDVGCAILVAFAPYIPSKLPFTLDANGQADLKYLYPVPAGA